MAEVMFLGVFSGVETSESRINEFLRGFIGAQSETYGVSGVLKTFYNGDRTEVQMGEKLVIKITANLSIRYRVAGWTT